MRNCSILALVVAGAMAVGGGLLMGQGMSGGAATMPE